MVKRITPILLLIPLIAVSLLVVLSCGLVFQQSLGVIPAFGLTQYTLDYFKQVFQSPAFWNALLLSLRISFLSSLGAIILGTVLCVWLVKANCNRIKRLLLVRIPILIPHTIVALFFIMLFSQTGLLARLAYAMGLIADFDQFPSLLFTPGHGGVLFAYIWKEAPFVAYYCFSLMNSINKTLGEAAENLGSSPLRAFLTVTLPLSFPAFLKAFLIILIFSFGAYELPFILGVSYPKALPVQAYLSHNGPDLRQRPYTMALFMVILAFSALLSLIFFFVLKRITRRYTPQENSLSGGQKG